MIPDFVIIGAMKCATSTLHDQLARIDGISMTEPKEPNFFSDELNWAKGMGWYESLFESMPVDDLKGESSTHYTKLPTYPLCIPRMHEHLPNAKLIYVMRDPIDRIVSYRSIFTNGRSALSRTGARLTTRSTATRCWQNTQSMRCSSPRM